MLSTVPWMFWNQIAETGLLKSRWAKKAFPMTEEQMSNLEAKEREELEKEYPGLVARAFLDLRPLLLENEAIQTWLNKSAWNRMQAGAFPEVLDVDEAVAMGTRDWMLDETKQKQLRSLLENALNE